MADGEQHGKLADADGEPTKCHVEGNPAQCSSRLVYSTDDKGKEILVLDTANGSMPYMGSNTVVMMEWEKEYMQALVQALRVETSSNVLEIGWGCGYSANAIQAHKPQQHVIIECSDDVLQRAVPWAARQSGARMVQGFWQDVLASQDKLSNVKFDRVFFDDFPLPAADGAASSAAAAPDSALTESTPARSRWCDFVEACLPHMAEGGIITGYMARPVDLEVAGVDVQISTCAVHVPDNCPYFPYDQACVALITVRPAAQVHAVARKKRKLHNLVQQSLGLLDE
ncbi:hypothetical protein JKP88DRAFT_178186 [Tribonema minus]|uniref:Guanidinoacetate N-methyltransferase n=1 Tax=Tribonema minus TaxID=303371 RepID=A0A835Z832_9STRA|nr:hypothetical protein JKP88DRAFT_178186 [Tribonema minus]